MLDPNGVVATWNAGRSASRATPRPRSSASTSRASIHPRRSRARLARRRTRDARRPRAASRTKAGACARTARVLGQRRHHGAARRGRRAARLRQDHARPDRAPPARRASCAQSEERFRLLVEGVVDYAIFMLDPDGIITSWNAGARAHQGLRAGRDHRPALLACSIRPRTSPPTSRGSD